MRHLCSQAHYFTTSPAGSLVRTQKELVIKLLGRVRLHHHPNKSMTMAPTQEGELTAPPEERTKEALMLALYLGQLICQKYLLGSNTNQCLCQILKQA